MIGDIWTIVRKELKEVVLQYGSGRLGVLGILAVPLLLGVFLPLQIGPEFVERGTGLVFWLWLPPFLVMTIVADSFAGERERHTLETLLASRLSDRAILFGKIGTSVAFGWGVTMLGLALSLVTVNVVHAAFGEGSLLFYPPALALGAALLVLLLGGAAATAGVLVSLRASSVRQVQQTIGLAILVLAFVPAFGVQLLPQEWRTQLIALVVGTSPILLMLVAGVALAALNAALLMGAMARFRRTRLTGG